MLQCHQRPGGKTKLTCKRREGPLFGELKVQPCQEIIIIGWPQVRKMMNCCKTVGLDFFSTYFYSCKVSWAGVLFDRNALIHIYTRRSWGGNLLLEPACLIIERWQMSSFMKVIKNEVPCLRIQCGVAGKGKCFTFISRHDLTYCHVIRDILAA